MDSTTTLDAHVEQEAHTSPLEPITTEMAAPSEKCPSCGARMAPDQRYCINCGERRSGGGLRDAMPRTQTAAAAAVPPRGPRLSANSSLIAGIATLLIAMGVGVLIGRTGDNSPKSAAGNQPVQVVTVPNGAAAATGAAAGVAGSTKTAKAAKKAKAKKGKSAAAKTQQTAAQNNVKLPPPVVKVGGACPKGAKGCQGGKFTGSFFGQ